MSEEDERMKQGWAQTSNLTDIECTIRVLYEVNVPQTSFPFLISLLVDGKNVREIVAAFDLLVSEAKQNPTDLHSLIERKLPKALAFLPSTKRLADEVAKTMWKLFSDGDIPTEEHVLLRILETLNADSETQTIN
jgi:hypothetical protein